MSALKTRSGWLAIAVVVALVAGWPAEARAAQSEEIKMEEMVFEGGAGGKLKVKFGDADIKVAPGSEMVEIETWVYGSDADFAREGYQKLNFTARQDGQTVILETDPDWNVNWGRNRWMNLEVRVLVPERFDLDLHTGDGDIVIGKLRGEVKLHTGDGDLSMADLEGPSITVRTGDGDVAAGRLAGDGVSVHTGDGDVQIAEAAGPIRVATGDGDVHVGGLSGDGSKITTGDGDVHVDLAQAVALELRTGDGDVRLSAPAALGIDIELHGADVHLGSAIALEGSIRDGHASGRLNGGGPLVRAHTGDGTIHLQLGNG